MGVGGGGDREGITVACRPKPIRIIVHTTRILIFRFSASSKNPWLFFDGVWCMELWIRKNPHMFMLNDSMRIHSSDLFCAGVCILTQTRLHDSKCWPTLAKINVARAVLVDISQERGYFRSHALCQCYSPCILQYSDKRKQVTNHPNLWKSCF